MSVDTEAALAMLKERTAGFEQRLRTLETMADAWGDRVENRVRDAVKTLDDKMERMSEAIARIEAKQSRQDGERVGARWLINLTIAAVAAAAAWIGSMKLGK